MEQILVWTLILAALLAGFVFYPKLMFGLLGAILRGIPSLIADCVALLFAWV
jgi:hypothetical protein